MVQLSHEIDDPSRSGKLYTKNVSLGTDGRRLVWMLLSAAHAVVKSGLRASNGAGATLFPPPAPPSVQVLL